MSKEFLKFDIESAEIIQEKEDSQFAIARIFAFASGKNLHDLYCSEETLKKTSKSIENCPILYNFENKNWGKFDFGNHTDPDKSLICGFTVPNTVSFDKIEDGTNRLALFVEGRIWKKYSEKAMEIFSKNPKKKISVEMALLDSKEFSENPEITEMLNFEYVGICLLGDSVTPAIEGANMEMISFAKENKETIEMFNKEFSSKYEESDIDFTIPDSVKNSSKKGLELYKEKSRGGNSVSLSIARSILKSSKITPDKLKRIAKHFGKSFENLSDKESDDWIEYQLFGGSSGKKWALSIIQRMEEIDKNKMSFFSGEDKEMLHENIKEVKNSMDDESKEKEQEVKEEEMAVVDPNEKTETPEEEKKESPELEQKEKESGEEKEMSLDSYLDTAVAQRFLEEETEDDQEMFAEFAKEDKKSVNWAVVAKKMFAICQKMSGKGKEFAMKFAEMEEKEKAYMSENAKLKEFKSSIEQSRFEFEVDSTLKEIENSVEMSKEELESLKVESAKFSVDNIDAWKNLARAKAFEHTSKKSKKDTIVRYSVLEVQSNQKQGNGSPWKSSN